MNYVTNTFLLVNSSVWSKQLLCFVQSEGQESEQKHTTKNVNEFHNHSPPLTMRKLRHETYRDTSYPHSGPVPVSVCETLIARPSRKLSQQEITERSVFPQQTLLSWTELNGLKRLARSLNKNWITFARRWQCWEDREIGTSWKQSQSGHADTARERNWIGSLAEVFQINWKWITQVSDSVLPMNLSSVYWRN